jgi:hypothetical protein
MNPFGELWGAGVALHDRVPLRVVVALFTAIQGTVVGSRKDAPPRLKVTRGAS